jgi:hypothetical protein
MQWRVRIRRGAWKVLAALGALGSFLLAAGANARWV